MPKRARISLPWYSWIFIAGRLRRAKECAPWPPAREGAGKCSTRDSRGDSRASPRAAPPAAPPASAGVVDRSVRGRAADASHQAVDQLGSEAAREQEARLRGVLGRVGRRPREPTCAHGGGALELARGERALELDGQLDAMAAELALDAPQTEARAAGVDARFGEALVREEAVRLEPVEERLDLSLRARGAVFIVRAVGGDERCARVTQQLGAQLDAAVLALSEQLQGARLQRARRALHGLSP